MGTATSQLLDIFQVLHKDVDTCITMLQEERTTNTVNPFAKRAYVRSEFAFVEGVIHRMKLLAFEDKDKPKVIFSPAELSFLLDEDFDINEKGEVIPTTAKVSLVRNIRFAFKAIARANSINYELTVGEAGWDAFKKSIKVRDRLTHPKSAEDLNLSKDDIDLVIKGSMWFIDNFNACMALIRDSLQNEPGA